MKLDLEMAKDIEINKSINLDINKDLQLMKKDAENIIVKVVDKAAGYAIRALPVPDGLKDILNDIRQSFKTKDFKQIIKTAVNSSIREGLELIGLESGSIKNIIKLKDVMIKGGLIEGIKAGVDIIKKSKLNNNIVGDHIYKFFDKLTNDVLSNSFKENLQKSFNKIDKDRQAFLQTCSNWYKAYDNFELDHINDLSAELQKMIKKINNNDCIKENNTIQNICKLVNNKKSKLSESQLQLCKVM